VGKTYRQSADHEHVRQQASRPGREHISPTGDEMESEWAISSAAAVAGSDPAGILCVSPGARARPLHRRRADLHLSYSFSTWAHARVTRRPRRLRSTTRSVAHHAPALARCSVPIQRVSGRGASASVAGQRARERGDSRRARWRNLARRRAAPPTAVRRRAVRPWASRQRSCHQV
jgi:hypothetical protein